MKNILKIFAVLFVIAFVFILPMSMTAFDIGRVVFNQALVTEIVTDEVIHSDLIPLALEWFSERRAQERVDTGAALVGINEPDVVRLMSMLSREDWRDVKEELLSDEILAEYSAETVNGVYEWIDTSYPVPQITWDLQNFIDRVNTEHGVNAILIAYGNLAPCTQVEIEDFTARLAAAPAGKEVLYNLCHFPEPWEEDQINDYVDSLRMVVNNVPREFALTDELRTSGEGPVGVGSLVIKQQLILIRTAMNLAWIAPIVLLILILAFAVRSLNDLARWLGIPLLISGLVMLLPALSYRAWITSLLAAGPLSETPEIIFEEAVRSLLNLFAHIFQPMLIQAIIFAVLGLALIIFYRVRISQKKTETPSENQAA